MPPLLRQKARLCALLLFCAFGLLADDASSAATVVAVWPQEARLGDIINIRVDHLESWFKPDATGKPPSGIVPFLGDVPLKGSRLDGFDPKTGTFRFTLLRNSADPASKEAWNHVLGGFGTMNGEGQTRKKLSIGRDDQSPVSVADTAHFTLTVFPLADSWIAFGTLLGLIVIFSVFRRMLKDPPQPPAVPGGPVGVQTFSLAKCQMAWWTFIVLTSYIFVWLVTGDFAFPASSLVLIGISSATALSAVIVQPAPNKGAAVSSFLKDLLYEDGQPTLHRFQMFAWTAVLGIIFIVKVVNELAQPSFDPSLLALMGISAGAYVGFKFS